MTEHGTTTAKIQPKDWTPNFVASAISAGIETPTNLPWTADPLAASWLNWSATLRYQLYHTKASLGPGHCEWPEECETRHLLIFEGMQNATVDKDSAKQNIFRNNFTASNNLKTCKEVWKLEKWAEKLNPRHSRGTSAKWKSIDEISYSSGSPTVLLGIFFFIRGARKIVLHVCYLHVQFNLHFGVGRLLAWLCHVSRASQKNAMSGFFWCSITNNPGFARSERSVLGGFKPLENRQFGSVIES